MKRVSTFVAMADIMTMFAIAILLLGEPKDQDTEGQVGTWWFRHQADSKKVDHPWTVLVEEDWERPTWYISSFRRHESDFVVMCNNERFNVVFPKEKGQWFPLDESYAWIAQVEYDQTVLLFDTGDGACTSLVNSIVEPDWTVGNFILMRDPPTEFSNWYWGGL